MELNIEMQDNETPDYDAIIATNKELLKVVENKEAEIKKLRQIRSSMKVKMEIMKMFIKRIGKEITNFDL